jgi:PAS domain S-box-containing protein
MRDITESKKTDEALKKSERKYQTLFETVRDGFASVNMAGRIVEANPAFLGMLGYTEDELLTMTCKGLTPEKWHALEEKIIQEQVLTRGYSDVYMKEYARKDGTVFPIEIRTHLLRDEEGHPSGMWAFVRDVTERVNAERTLRQSEERFATVFRAGPIGASLTRFADGKFSDVNDAFLRLFGYERDEVIGSNPLSLNMWVNADDRARMINVLRERSRVSGFETSFRTKTGETREVLVAAELVDVAQERCILGLALDITEHKHAEDALRESETKLRTILEASRDAIGVSKDGIRTFANPASVSLFGYESADELIGAPVIDVIAPESHGFFKEMVRKRAAGDPIPPFYEVTALKKDGTTFLMEITVSSYFVKGEQFALTVLRDITDRKKALKQLEETEERFRKIFEESPLGIVMVGSDHCFVRANAAFCRMLGYTEQELIALTFEDITHPEHVAEDALHVKELFSGKIALYRTEKRYVRKDKEIVWGSSTVTIIRDESGKFLYFLTMIEDITQRKQAEGEKARLEEQLRQAQKMEAVGTLAGGVAHDFNNILTVIMGLGNLMQTEIDKDDIHRTYVDQIVASSARAADLTQSLLAFSRKQRITLEAHTVNGVVTSTTKLLKRLLPEDIGFSVNLTDKDTPSLLDVTQIGQVLMNLATNARDAMPHGGSLTITTGRTRIDKNFTKTHGFGRPGEYAKLSVADTGIGIDESTMKRIFEPFFTTKEIGKGTGLGLASAYGIVKQHKGYITVSSIPFKGTTFDIYLPLIKTPSRKKARAAGETKGGTETILIVEDDRDVRNMLTKILGSHGYATIEAVDGDDAIGVFTTHREEIDLIILDVVMPGKNGAEALGEITRTDHSVKAIFVSGYTGDVVIEKGIQSESVDFLQKPLSVQALLGKVREVLDR